MARIARVSSICGRQSHSWSRPRPSTPLALERARLKAATTSHASTSVRYRRSSSATLTVRRSTDRQHKRVLSARTYAETAENPPGLCRGASGESCAIVGRLRIPSSNSQMTSQFLEPHQVFRTAETPIASPGPVTLIKRTNGGVPLALDVFVVLKRTVCVLDRTVTFAQPSLTSVRLTSCNSAADVG
ncbi:hypothetical protein TKK_0000121 [Trichogramma kaykai]